MRKRTALFTLPILFLILFSCTAERTTEADATINPLVARDLAEIKADGKLKVLVSYSSTSYFLYKGQPMGFEYELLQRLAKALDLELDLILMSDMDNMFRALNQGKADVVAHGITITSDRKQKVAFTNHLYLTSQVLVQRKPDNWRTMAWAALQSRLKHDAIDLIGDTVAVRKQSAYLKRMGNLSEELGDTIYIDTLPGNLSTERIIKMVVDREIPYTVADENLAKVNAAYYPVLDIEVPVSFSQRIAWAVRKNAPELQAAINAWIAKEKKEAPYYVIYNRYFENQRNFRRRIRSDFLSLNGNAISQYDNIIQTHAEELGWDWRLLASLVYQESRFQPNAESWAGAQGLFQMMPATAEAMGVTDRNDPAQSVRGGTKYLQQLYADFSDIPDSLQRIKFTMAAYNCGYYHIKDAQVLAERNDLDPLVWDNNVEEMVLALTYPDNYNQPGIEYGYVRGIEPVTYVEQIFERYDHYTNFIEQENPTSI